MSLQLLAAPRFIRRTNLRPNEYRKNFRQLDREVIDAVTSAEADRVTPLMSKIYLKLANAPEKYWEREGVLRFEADPGGEGRPATAWARLCEVVGVASATAAKALRWMHEQGIIGYFAGKNGVGVRIFLNRATSSIGVRRAQEGEKILALPLASSGGRRASAGEAAFSDSFAVSEVLDTDLNPRAPKSGAESKPSSKASLTPAGLPNLVTRTPSNCAERERPVVGIVSVEQILERLRGELEACVKEVAARAAATSAAREMERTREWFETKALPKAARVAQHETYDLLRKHVGIRDRRGPGSARLEVGRASGTCEMSSARPLTWEEVRETAEVCLALLETQGKSVEVTLSEISSEGGGWLLPEDAPRVREAVCELLPLEGKREEGLKLPH